MAKKASRSSCLSVAQAPKQKTAGQFPIEHLANEASRKKWHFFLFSRCAADVEKPGCRPPLRGLALTTFFSGLY
jgi:hypothetical protein